MKKIVLRTILKMMKTRLRMKTMRLTSIQMTGEEGVTARVTPPHSILTEAAIVEAMPDQVLAGADTTKETLIWPKVSRLSSRRWEL